MTEPKGSPRRMPDHAAKPLDEQELRKHIDRISQEVGVDFLFVFFYRKDDQLVRMDPQPTTEQVLARIVAEAEMMGMGSVPVRIDAGTPDDPTNATVQVDRVALQRAIQQFVKK